MLFLLVIASGVAGDWHCNKFCPTDCSMDSSTETIETEVDRVMAFHRRREADDLIDAVATGEQS